MTRTRGRGPGLALLAAALAACARVASGGPVPLAVEPPQATGAEDVPLEITGRGFTPVVHTDYGDASRSTLDGGFAASLVPAAGGDAVPLSEVTLTPRGTLTGRIPPGLRPLPTGVYALVVVDPAGRSGRLEDAFRVVTAPESVVGFQIAGIEDVTAGIPFRVAATAVDVMGRTVDSYADTVDVEGVASTIAPLTLTFSNGRASNLFTIGELTASVRVALRDALGRTGASNAFAVMPGPPQLAVLASAPSLAAGACSAAVDLELRDVLGHPAPAPAPVAVRVDAAPPGAAIAYSDAGCTAPTSFLSMAAGASRASFRLRALAAGPLALRLVPEGVPSLEVDVDVAP